ncbi:MAG: RsmB/NOP family class I SAM-dependent RNA methyltransferase [Candidatus Hodarchaeales archaeon]|jgi:ribosomal RNA methyltransferase Nop2
MKKPTISKSFIERWKTFYGEERTREILNHLEKPDPRILAPNTLKTKLIPLMKRLESKGFKFSPANGFEALILQEEPFNIVSTPEYLSGMFSIQALTSILPPKTLNPSPENFVIDMTASPGIKTCFLAQKMANQGTILAIEKSRNRLSALKANLIRMGVFNTIILNFDATEVHRLEIQADNILLDAPCSGTGLKLSKNKRLEPRLMKDITRHAKLQKILLENAWQWLKPNGTMVYSTCSLEPEEGEKLIFSFVSQHEKEVKLLPLFISTGISGGETQWNDSIHPQLENTKRFLPDIGVDGFFMAKLQKRCS